MTLRALLNKVDRIPEPILLCVNLVLAGFVLVSHGGALAVTYEDTSAMAAEIRRQAMISLPLTALIVVTAALALVRVSARRVALAVHGVVFIGGALYALVYASGVAIWGLPTMPGHDTYYFVWSVGLLSVCVWYAVFLASRYSVPMHARGNAAIFYAPVVALAVAVVIDVAISLRMLHELDKLFG